MSKFFLAWKPSPWFLAEINHVLAAALLVLFADRLGWPAAWTVAAIVAVTALKEFWADLTWLEHDTFVGSLEDFASYMTGTFGVWLALAHPVAGTAVVGAFCFLLAVADILDQYLMDSPHL